MLDGLLPALTCSPFSNSICHAQLVVTCGLDASCRLIYPVCAEREQTGLGLALMGLQSTPFSTPFEVCLSLASLLPSLWLWLAVVCGLYAVGNFLWTINFAGSFAHL